MNRDQLLEEYVKGIKGLNRWRYSDDLPDRLLRAVKENERSKASRLIAAAGILALFFSAVILAAGIKNRQEQIDINLKQFAEIYEVNNLEY